MKIESTSLETKINGNLETLFEHCLQHNFPFIAYQTPQQNEPQTLVSFNANIQPLSTEKNWLSQKGFVVMPFQVSVQTPAYFIQPDLMLKGEEFVLEQPLPTPIFAPPTPPDKNVYAADQETYMNLVNQIIDTIETTSLQKAIASRISVYPKDKSFSAVSLFKALNKKYLNAFTYLLFIPKVGCWLGASPEAFLQKRGKDIRTVALAGTQWNDGQTLAKNIQWEAKELAEQALVSQHIKKCLNAFTDMPLSNYQPQTVAAGKLWHLQTIFKAKIESGIALKKVIEQLHPTPAVGGLPKQEAIDFILKNETHQRSYYTGFLGPVNMDNACLDLFVNLRCMQVLPSSLAFYTGAGITVDSVAEKEWLETEHKVSTLFDVVKEGRVTWDEGNE